MRETASIWLPGLVTHPRTGPCPFGHGLMGRDLECLSTRLGPELMPKKA